MLDIKDIRKNPDLYRKGLQKRAAAGYINKLIQIDTDYRRKITELDGKRSIMNQTVKEISRESGTDERKIKIAEAQQLKEAVKSIERALEPIRKELDSIMYKLPNLPLAGVPEGKNEADNKILRNVGQKKTFSFKPRDYFEIATKLDLIDTERASRVAGSRFGYLKGQLVMTQFAIIQFTLARLTNEAWLEKVIKKAKLSVSPKAFIPVLPPDMIRMDVFRAMGKLDPGQEEERYHLPKDDLYLIGSAEHTLGPYYQNETISAEQLPIRFIGYSTNFRREAGSYGKDTRGILRVHQFDKLEMFSFSRPDSSSEEHRLFLAIQEALMQELKLPYRVVHVCAGDMVSTDAEQFDIESWLPGQNNAQGEYRETHSTSNSTDFQARRLNTKYSDGKNTALVHTINGTAFALGRTLIALIENYQTKDGRINFPKILLK